MLGPRYVVLALASPRATWLRTVAQWAQASAIPVQLVKCVSAEELCARLATNRPFSAVVVDANLPALDRDLIDSARQAGSAVIVVEDRRSRRSWASLGASAVLVGAFDQSDLVAVLRQHAPPIPDPEIGGAGTLEDAMLASSGRAPSSAAHSAIVVAVCGSGGVGTSTLAMALAQGLADREVPPDPHDPPVGYGNARLPALAARDKTTHGWSPQDNKIFRNVEPPLGYEERSAGTVLLVDMARRADQSLLHDARDVVPGIQELVEAHRNAKLGPAQVRSLTFDIEQRGYHLLLGLRRACDWAGIRRRAFEAAFASVLGAYGAVVCDIDSDFETERDGGSADVEDRNVMALTALSTADVVVAVGLPGVKGAHSLIRLLRDLAGAGVAADRVVPVFNRAPKSGRTKGELAAVLTQLADLGPRGSDRPRDRHQGPASPIFVPERTIDEMAGHAARLPSVVVDPLVASVHAVLQRSDRLQRSEGPTDQSGEPRRILPGSLGTLCEDDDDETALG